MKTSRLLAFLALCLSSRGPAGAAPLTFDQVAQHAYDAGFHGGSLTYAIAVADAESGREPLAVSNNYAITLENGTPVMLPNGKQRIEGVPAMGPAAMVPVLDPADPAAVRAIPQLRMFGRPVSHCRGLWQMNDALENPHNQPLDPFDPRLAAVRAWRHTRCGVHWWRYISVMRGTAWEPSRLAAARKAAARLDPSTLPDQPQNLRVIALRDGGVVREDLTKNMTRKTRAGDTGTVREGPLVAQITDGSHTSWHPFIKVEWDWGGSGWVSEAFLATTPEERPQEAERPVLISPGNGETREWPETRLSWQRRANTSQLRVLFGSSPDLDPPDKVFEPGVLEESVPLSLDLDRSYYWRVEAAGPSGNWVSSDIATFRTRRPPATPVTFSNLALSHTVWPLNRTITITGTLTSSIGQQVLIGASWRDLNDSPHDIAVTTPAGGGAVNFSRTFVLPNRPRFGLADVIVTAYKDWDGDGLISVEDEVVNTPVNDSQLIRAGEITREDNVLPQLITFTAAPAAPAVVPADSTVSIAWRFRDEDSRPRYCTIAYQYPLMPRVTGIVALEQNTSLIPDGDQPVELSGTLEHFPPQGGLLRYTLTATDSAGNSITAQRDVMVAETVPPSVTIDFPSNGSLSVSGTAFGTASDLSGIATVEYRHDGGAWQLASGRQNWTASLATTEGPHLLEVRATDTQGNISAPQSLTYVVETHASDPSTFTEQLGFGGTTQHWEEGDFNPGPGGFSGFQGGLYADGAGFSAAVHRPKPVPAWAHAVEMTFSVERQALFRWEDESGAMWQGGIRSPAGVHEAFLGSSVPTASALAEQPTRSRVKILIFDGRMTLQAGYGPPPIQHLAAMDVPLPGLRLAALRTLRWQVDAPPDSGTALLKDVRIRALRHSDLLQITAFQPINETGRLSLEWASFNNRSYQIFSAPSLSGPWLPAASSLSSGIRTEAQFPASAAGARMFYRVQELDW